MEANDLAVTRSFDPATQSMLRMADKKGYETAWDRFEAQKPHCGYGELGICCRHCTTSSAGRCPPRGLLIIASVIEQWERRRLRLQPPSSLRAGFSPPIPACSITFATSINPGG